MVDAGMFEKLLNALRLWTVRAKVVPASCDDCGYGCCDGGDSCYAAYWRTSHLAEPPQSVRRARSSPGPASRKPEPPHLALPTSSLNNGED